MTFYLKIVLFLFPIFISAIATNLSCTDECCYYYHGVPKNITTTSCNPEGRTVELECQLYTSISRDDSTTNLSVMWYRSATEELVRQSGELITAERKKYAFSESHASLPVNNSGSIIHGLFFSDFNLRITNFDSSIDNGYYWCQMVVNNLCLQPSDYGHVLLNPSNASACNFGAFDFVEFKEPQVCARSAQCTTQVMTTQTEGVMTPESDTSTMFEATTSADSSTTSLSGQASSSSTTMIVTLYVIIGILAFIVVLLLLVVAAFTVNTVRNRRTFSTKKRDHHGVEMSNVQRQSFNIYDQSEYPHTTNGSFPTPPRNSSPSSPTLPPPNESPPPPTLPAPSNPPPQSAAESNDSARNDSSVPGGEDVHYASPNHHQPRQGTAVVPSGTTVAGQYQDLRFSRLDYTPVYTVANVQKSGNELRTPTTPKYENIPT